MWRFEEISNRDPCYSLHVESLVRSELCCLNTKWFLVSDLVLTFSQITPNWLLPVRREVSFLVSAQWPRLAIGWRLWWLRGHHHLCCWLISFQMKRCQRLNDSHQCHDSQEPAYTSCMHAVQTLGTMWLTRAALTQFVTWLSPYVTWKNFGILGFLPLPMTLTTSAIRQVPSVFLMITAMPALTWRKTGSVFWGGETLFAWSVDIHLLRSVPIVSGR